MPGSKAPETEAVWNRPCFGNVQAACERMRQLSEKHEIERDETYTKLQDALKERDQWKANHDNQVRLKATLMDRPDLKDRAKRMRDLIRERDELYAQLHGHPVNQVDESSKPNP